MSKLPLHLKYRPSTFAEIIGNNSLIDSLQIIFKNFEKTKTGKIKWIDGEPVGRGITTILLQGPTGCGKTTIARIIAKEVGARDQDIKELNIADARGIDAARTIIENARFMPLGGKAKVYILDEVANATTNFFEALLKILEEPPRKTYFILCTTDPGKLPKTIRNRCTIYEVNSLRRNELTKLIKNVLIEERRRKFPKEAIEKIAISADGCPRQALVLLDSVIDIEDDEKLLAAINDFSSEKAEIVELFNALLKKTKWSEMAKILKNIDEEPEKLRYAILTRMTNILLSGKQSDRAFLIIDEFKSSFIYTKKAGLASACYSICNM